MIAQCDNFDILEYFFFVVQKLTIFEIKNAKNWLDVEYRNYRLFDDYLCWEESKLPF